MEGDDESYVKTFAGDYRGFFRDVPAFV